MQTISTERKEADLGTGHDNAGTNKTICFDVDGTLRDYYDRPRRDVIETLLLFVRAGWRVFVWSGGGRDYAENVGRLLKLPESVAYTSKTRGVVVDGVKVKPDIAVDDQEVSLGIRNIKVKMVILV